MRRAFLVLVPVLALVGCGGGAGPTSTVTVTQPVPTSSSPAEPSPEPTVTDSASPSATPNGRTRITFQLAEGMSCRNGRIGVWNTTTDPFVERSAKIAGGAASIEVRSSATQRMSFDISCDGWPDTGAVPGIVLQYRGTDAGTSPETDDAGMPTASRASWCWAGTDAPEVVIELDAYLDNGDGSPFSGVAAVWADPMLQTVEASDGSRWQEAFDGMLGHQDAPYC